MCQECLPDMLLISHMSMHVQARSVWNKADFTHNFIHATYYMLRHVPDGRSYNISCLPVQRGVLENARPDSLPRVLATAALVLMSVLTTLFAAS